MSDLGAQLLLSTRVCKKKSQMWHGLDFFLSEVKNKATKHIRDKHKLSWLKTSLLLQLQQPLCLDTLVAQVYLPRYSYISLFICIHLSCTATSLYSVTSLYILLHTSVYIHTHSHTHILSHIFLFYIIFSFFTHAFIQSCPLTLIHSFILLAWIFLISHTTPSPQVPSLCLSLFP